MRSNEPAQANQPSNVQCVEVLIPKTFISNSGHHLFRTLSIYSLHNHPVRNNPSAHHSEIFHFMVYDWKRTLRQLLEQRKVPFTILQYFSPDTIYYETLIGDLSETADASEVVFEGAN